MAFRKYTQCYTYPPGDKPFNIKEVAGIALLYGLLPGAFFGLITGLAVGFLAGGPIGAIIGMFAGLTTGWALGLTRVSNEWRNHRLVCLTGFQCAVGTVNKDPKTGGLGNFDNDEFFDLTLMPHRPEDDYLYADIGKPGVVKGAHANDTLAAHPQNDVFKGFQGKELLTKIKDLPFDPVTDPEAPNNRLHCEAEGDFWKRMADLASALGALLAALTIVTAGATYAGAAAGASTGCSIGSIFGPIGCLIGGIIGGLIGGALAGGAAGAASYGIVSATLNAIFKADPGDVDDANVGDKEPDAIRHGDKVIVYGEHVYDGFHDGWHEIHPLMQVVKLADRRFGTESRLYLEWNPDMGDADPLPEDLPDMPAAITKLTVDDMRKGQGSDKFRDRAIWLRDRWCGLLHEAFDDGVRTKQHGLSERWTIHPSVDGCVPEPPPPSPPREPDPIR